jgi:hypothetical protein
MGSITAGDFAYQRNWERFILGYRGALPKNIRKPTLIAYCFAMAQSGSAGIDCFKSDATIAAEIGIYHRGDIAKYRRCALGLGWFIVVKCVGRARHLDIQIPNEPVECAGCTRHRCPTKEGLP